MRTDVHRFGLIDYGEVSGLPKAIEGGYVKPKEIVAVIGVEIRTNEVVVVGTSASWTGPLTVGHALRSDPLDIGSVVQLARDLGFTAEPQIPSHQAARIPAAFVKCESPRDGTVRGEAHTMPNDGDMDPQRHIRGAVGAIVASVLNNTALFVSGGAEHQGPDTGAMIAVIAEKPGAGAELLVS